MCPLNMPDRWLADPCPITRLGIRTRFLNAAGRPWYCLLSCLVVESISCIFLDCRQQNGGGN